MFHKFKWVGLPLVIKKMPLIIQALNTYLFNVIVRHCSTHSAPQLLVSTLREQGKQHCAKCNRSSGVFVSVTIWGSSFPPTNPSWHPPPGLPPPSTLKTHDHPFTALSAQSQGKSCENEDVSSNFTLRAWSLGSYYAPFASLHWLWWKRGKEAMTGQKGALHQNTFCLGSLLAWTNPSPHITANTFPCSFSCLRPSLAPTPTCLHIHFIKLRLSNALCSVQADCPLLFNWPTPPLLLNKWEGQWLLMTCDDDVCQCGPKDTFVLGPHHQEPVACTIMHSFMCYDCKATRR